MRSEVSPQAAFQANRLTAGMGSKTSIEDQELVILGTEYAGEMKGASLTVANHLAPKRGNRLDALLGHDPAAYDAGAKKLADLFIDNFKKYEHGVDPEAKAASSVA